MYRVILYNTLWCDHYGVLLESALPAQGGRVFQSSREWSVKLTIHAKGQRFELDQNKCELEAEISLSEYSEISCSQEINKLLTIINS